MKYQIEKTHLPAILPLRDLFLQETNFQIRYHACHERNWTDSYLISVNKEPVGYGSVIGIENRGDRNDIFEFYLIPAYRKWKSRIFSSLLTETGAAFIECQSNDLTLSAMLFEFAENISSGVTLFADDRTTDLHPPGMIFRQREQQDQLFEHKGEPEGDYVIELDNKIIATGGYLTHYNKPFADLYMEVKEDFRMRGAGSFLLQEIKRACYQHGRVPAARCDMNNKASWSSLLKAGFHECGFMLTGTVKNTAY